MQTKVKTHKGVDIYVNETGQFSATFQRGHERNHTCSRKDLRAVEREIEQSKPKGSTWPGMRVMSTLPQFNHYGSRMPPPLENYVAGYRLQPSRGRYSNQPYPVLTGKDGLDLNLAGSYFEFDQEAFDKMTEIAARFKALQKESDDYLKEFFESHRGREVSANRVKALVEEWEQSHTSAKAL